MEDFDSMSTIEILEILFVFAGGLGMFLYGMHVMADGLQKSAGGKMKRLLGYLTQNRLVAVLVGTLVTSIIQSSSATTVMVVVLLMRIMNLSYSRYYHGSQYWNHSYLWISIHGE